jgi:NAD-dependent dihydropyrimidine dehydrogenase PreA subunit
MQTKPKSTKAKGNQLRECVYKKRCAHKCPKKAKEEKKEEMMP